MAEIRRPIRPKEHTRLGMFHLEEAVLDVLLEAKERGESMWAYEIGKRAGIFSAHDGIEITYGILIKLRIDGRVQNCKKRPDSELRDAWELTAEEYITRRDDVS